MKTHRYYKTLAFLLFANVAFAQKIDNTVSFRDIKSEGYFRFLYDNDYFTASDLYYTQGYNFELVKPWLKGNPLNTVLLRPKGNEVRYGLSFEQTGYIPTDISDDQIRYGDRPYAATIALKSFVIATDTISRSRIASSLTTGMIGPVAIGDEMQTGIHKWIGDELPMGWQYQIKNDIVLDYELAYEKQLVQLKRLLRINLDAKARLGTLNTYASAGLNASLGLINAPFTSSKNKNHFSAYLYSQPVVKAVGYDATLQGGLFTDSPYTIPNSDVERIVMQNNYGIVIQFHTLYFEYSRTDITKEFKTGSSHKWGGFRIGFTL